MKKPIIGIPSKIQNRRIGNDLWRRQEVVDELRYLVIRHGGIAVMLMPSELTYQFNESDLGDPRILSEEEIADLHTQADLCDGIILQGGDYSCAYEVEIARYALEKDMPLMGICAGFNNILRALGSNIREDMTGTHSVYDRNYRHHISIVKGSRMYDFAGSEDMGVNTFHTMVADPDMVEPYAKIDACSDDGLVECFEVGGKRFAMGFKWHPELMEDDCTDRIFAAFLKACKNRR